MEPRIQYAKTSDGVNIAYCDTLHGVPVVFVTNIWSHIAATGGGLQQGTREAAVAAGARLVHYDGRGMGSSDRDSKDFSLEARLRDIEAVVDHLDLRRFVLLGAGHFSQTAIAYAVRHAHRVSHLVLINAFADGARAYLRVPMMSGLESLRSMADDQWDTYTRTAASMNTHFADARLVETTAAVYRDSMRPDTLRAMVLATREINVEPLLAQISMPTLILIDQRSLIPAHLSREVGVAIPAAQVQYTSDEAGGEAMAAIATFLGAQAPAQSSRSASGTAVILFADIVDSTALTERLGDAAFRAQARELDGALRGVIREHAGTPIEGKLLGDGVLAVFTSAREAIEAALACGAAGSHAGLPLHLGLHAGDVIREEGNVYGGAVNVAARISGLSAAGEVLVSETVRSLARTSAGVRFEDRGEQGLKGVGEAVRVWAVVEGG